MRGVRSMFRVFGGAALILGGAIAVALAHVPARSERSVLRVCPGMELIQNAAPNEAAPDGNSADTPQDDGPGDGDDQVPDGRPGADGGDNPDQASPPDSEQPPGCVFRKEPLELIV